MTRATDSPAERDRVRLRIEDHVLQFVRDHASWYESELADYVRARCGGSASSASRILRLLKTEGRINYAVDRARSFYRRIPVEAPQPRPYRPAVQQPLFSGARA